MPMFKDPDELEKVLGGFFLDLVERRKSDDPAISEPFDILNNTKLVVIFDLRGPELKIFIDCTIRPIEVTFNDKKRADATLIVDADIGHKFWLGKVNLAKALVKKDVVALGPVPKLLKLLPTVKKFYPIYARYLEDNGWGHLK
jgi:hypothetical protein